MEVNGASPWMIPSAKIDRSEWDNDPMPEGIPAGDVIAGDLVAGLGIVGAVLPFRYDGQEWVILAAGEDSLTVRGDQEVTVHGAICPKCDMHPIDCFYYSDTCNTGA